MFFRPRAVIFDADGVLLDSLSIWKNLGKRYILKLGYTPVPGMDEILFPMSLEQGVSWLKENFSISFSGEEIRKDLEEEIREYYFKEVQPKPGTADLLKQLAQKRIPAVVATSSPGQLVETALKRNGLFPYLKSIYTTSELGKSKYSPLIYEHAAGELGESPGDILVVEDSLYALNTARNAGFQTAGIYDALGEPDQKQLKITADVYCTDLKELQDLFTNI